MAVQPKDIKGYAIAGLVLTGLFLLIAIMRGLSSDGPAVGDLPVPNPQPVKQKRIEAKSFRITMPAKATVGQTILVRVEALNDRGGYERGYVGVVSIKSDLLSLPEKSRYLPGEQGRHEYKARVVKAGVETIEISDPSIGVLSKSQPITIVEKPPETTP